MNFVNTLGAFNAAVALRPDIISCSWGSDIPNTLSAADLALEASVVAAVASGITVVLRRRQRARRLPRPASRGDLGGRRLHGRFGGLEASSYASGFQSNIYPGRRVPDICGLVGQRPKAIYIMLPVEPGDQIDTGNNAGDALFPDGDETSANDGWAAFSGTSAAAPQIAGVAALMKQLVPTITPLGVRSSLGSTARDVETGFCSPVSGIHNGLPALPGPDDATGPGLVDAYAAVAWAYVTRGAAASAVTPASMAEPPTNPDLAAAYWQGYTDAATFAHLRSAGYR